MKYVSMKKKSLHFVPAILCMVFIFYMSHQPATVSGDMSATVGMWIGKVLVPQFETFSLDKQMAYAEHIDFWVRKVAHICEYALLGCLMAHAFVVYEKRWTDLGSRTWLIYAWGISVIYAVTDEVHQNFVPGRACMIRDMFIDSLGAFFGLVFYVCVVAIVKKLILKKRSV